MSGSRTSGVTAVLIFLIISPSGSTSSPHFENPGDSNRPVALLLPNGKIVPSPNATECFAPNPQQTKHCSEPHKGSISSLVTANFANQRKKGFAEVQSRVHETNNEIPYRPSRHIQPGTSCYLSPGKPSLSSVCQCKPKPYKQNTLCSFGQIKTGNPNFKTTVCNHFQPQSISRAITESGHMKPNEWANAEENVNCRNMVCEYHTKIAIPPVQGTRCCMKNLKNGFQARTLQQMNAGNFQRIPCNFPIRVLHPQSRKPSSCCTDGDCKTIWGVPQRCCCCKRVVTSRKILAECMQGPTVTMPKASEPRPTGPAGFASSRSLLMPIPPKCMRIPPCQCRPSFLTSSLPAIPFCPQIQSPLPIISSPIDPFISLMPFPIELLYCGNMTPFGIMANSPLSTPVILPQPRPPGTLSLPAPNLAFANGCSVNTFLPLLTGTVVTDSTVVHYVILPNFSSTTLVLNSYPMEGTIIMDYPNTSCSGAAEY